MNGIGSATPLASESRTCPSECCRRLSRLWSVSICLLVSAMTSARIWLATSRSLRNFRSFRQQSWYWYWCLARRLCCVPAASENLLLMNLQDDDKVAVEGSLGSWWVNRVGCRIMTLFDWLFATRNLAMISKLNTYIVSRHGRLISIYYATYISTGQLRVAYFVLMYLIVKSLRCRRFAV